MQSSKLICYPYFPLIIHYLVLTKFLSNFQEEYCEVPRFFLSLIEKFNSPITRCRLVRTFPFSYHNILLKQLESHRRNENKALAFSPFAVASSSWRLSSPAKAEKRRDRWSGPVKPCRRSTSCVLVLPTPAQNQRILFLIVINNYPSARQLATKERKRSICRAYRYSANSTGSIPRISTVEAIAPL